MALIGSDLDVFPINLGGNTFGWTTDEAASAAVLDAYVAGGGNFVDTSDSYSAWVPGHVGGESESIIGRWMTARGSRASVVVATKVSQHPEHKGLAPANIAAAADASLERLQTDYIDLYYAHYDDGVTPMVEIAAAFNDLVVAGKVRAVGVSNMSRQRISEWLALADRGGFAAPVALQPNYNLVNREPYESELAPLAIEHGLAVMPYFSLAAGFLTGKYRTEADLAGKARSQMASTYFTPAGLAVVDALAEIGEDHSVSIATTALAWLLAQPEITAPLASATSPEQLKDLLAAPTVTLTDDEVAQLDDVSAAVTNGALAE
jgi:aryl-alcohol dehydrogenase-like predicted oxidoreductase